MGFKTLAGVSRARADEEQPQLYILRTRSYPLPQVFRYSEERRAFLHKQTCGARARIESERGSEREARVLIPRHYVARTAFIKLFNYACSPRAACNEL